MLKPHHLDPHQLTQPVADTKPLVPPNATLIRGVRVPGGSQSDLITTDLAISEGQLVPPTDLPAGAQVIDADGLVALPGLVDVHTHLRQPGREDAETIATGSAAAAAGGFTAILAMANTNPVTDTAEAAEHVAALGRQTALADVHPIGAVTKGLAGKELAELGLMAASSARVRVFSDDGLCVADAGVMRRALEYVRRFGGVISQHAQDPTLAGPSSCCHEGLTSAQLGLPGWPTVAEEVIVARDVMLAKHTGSRVHIAHLTSAESVEILRWAKARRIEVTCEVTPHHLMLTDTLLADYDPVYKVNPPLRPAETAEALRAGLADGTIDMVATDHAPHAPHDKQHAFPTAAFGMLGSETALSVVHTLMVTTGRMTWTDVARTMSHTPAQVAGLSVSADGIHPQGRPLAPGEPANLVLFDPTASWVPNREHSKSLSRNNPWHGVALQGQVVRTLRRGVTTYSAETTPQPAAQQEESR